MNEQQRLFLVQARSDFAVFQLLSGSSLARCHALHYLQMATELLGKAQAWKHGPPRSSHRAFVGLLRGLATNRAAQASLGFADRNHSWQQLLRKSIPLAERIEDLAPALTPNGPNSEYPWPRDFPTTAPVEHAFDVWQELNEKAGRRFLSLAERLFDAADSFL